MSRSKLCYDRRSVGQSVLVSDSNLGPMTRFLLIWENCGFDNVGRPSWREDWSVVYNCCLALPEQSLSAPSTASIIHIFTGSNLRLLQNTWIHCVGTSVRTSQETYYLSGTEPNRLMLFGETVAVYCENHTEHINTLCGHFSPYLTRSMLRLHYRAQQVNVVWGNSRCLLWEPYGTHKYTVWALHFVPHRKQITSCCKALPVNTV
jgi:hypothetical protein